jgi:hypothetical protein
MMYKTESIYTANTIDHQSVSYYSDFYGIKPTPGITEPITLQRFQTVSSDTVDHLLWPVTCMHKEVWSRKTRGGKPCISSAQSNNDQIPSPNSTGCAVTALSSSPPFFFSISLLFLWNTVHRLSRISSLISQPPPICR